MTSHVTVIGPDRAAVSATAFQWQTNVGFHYRRERGKKANMPTSLLWFHQRGALVDAPFTWSGNIREHWERRRRRRTFSPANACLDSDGEVWVSLNFHKDSWMRWCQSAESPKTATAPTTRGRRQNVQYPWKHWTLEKLFLDVFPVHTNVENIMIIHKKM